MAKKRRPIAASLPLPTLSTVAPRGPGDRHCALCRGSGVVTVVAEPPASAPLRTFFARCVPTLFAVALVVGGAGRVVDCPGCVERSRASIEAVEGFGIVVPAPSKGGRR